MKTTAAKTSPTGVQGFTFSMPLINLDSVSTVANKVRVEEACPEALACSNSSSNALLLCFRSQPGAGCPFV